MKTGSPYVEPYSGNRKSARNSAPIMVPKHRVVQAWNRFCSKRLEPNLIEILQEVRKASSESCVYRLHGVGPGSTTVIAKRCIARYADVEEAVYAEILPHLPISHLTFYGCVDEPQTEYRWLFLEDAEGEEFVYSIEEHRRLAARWLGQMHVSAVGLPVVSRLPDRGPDYYLNHLRRTRQLIEANLGSPTLKAQDFSVLEVTLSQNDFLESQWSRVEDLCDSFPKTVVHCDFSKHNLRVRASTTGADLMAFDWAKAGHGIPAPDIAEASGRGAPRRWVDSDPPDIELVDYWGVVREAWPHLDLAAIRQLVDLGAAFRLLSAISWVSESIERDWCPTEELRRYQADLGVAIERLGLV